MLTLPRTKHIDLRLDDSVLNLTMNRPEARNAMSAEMVAEITEAFDSLEDSGVRAVVLRGAEGNFCSGGDVKDMAALLERSQKNDLEFVTRYNAAAGKLFSKVNKAPLAVIAVLEGAVMGGGLGLACAADITIALRNARFGLPETSLGLIPAQVSPFIRHRIGESYARLLAVMGGQFDAAWARQIGLVHFLVEDERESNEKLAEVLSNIKSCAPQALATAKRLMFDPVTSVTDDPDRLGLLFAKTMVGDEAREGTTAFIEKRKPEWNR